MHWSAISRLLFLLPPERAHVVTLRLLRLGYSLPPLRNWIERSAIPHGPGLATELLGLRFRNPIGLAAGFDKNAWHLDLLQGLGFGFLEVGAVTAKPWPGNSQPRLLRLRHDRALVNRMGLNNDGADVIATRLEHARPTIGVPIFANVAKTPAPMAEEQGIADYVATLRRLAPVADALVLNVSCPNTEDGRTFEDPQLLDRLLAEARQAVPAGTRPLLVKLSPDQEEAELRDMLGVIRRHRVDGIVAINTTVHRQALSSEGARRADRFGMGGLSGAPIREKALSRVARIRDLTAGEVPIVGVGGISSARHARAFLDAGASLLQLYTGLVYEGPFIVRGICDDPSMRTGRLESVSVRPSHEK